MAPRNARKTNSRFKISNAYEPTKIALKFDITMLNNLVGYLFKDSKQVTRKALTNMKKLFDIIDERIYESNDKLEARFNFIQRALKARLELGMENESLITNFCRSDTASDENEEIIKNLPAYKKINYDEIRYINKAIADRLNFAFMLQYKDEIYELMERLDSGEYDSFQEINKQVSEVFRDFLNETRKTNVLEDVDTFTLDPESFEDTMTDIVTKLKDPARILKTGIKCLNQILAPGYMSKRLYIYMGLPAGFKSGILLKTAQDIKKYNKGVPTKKAGKRKTVLIVTMENSVEETVERLFNMTVTTNDIREYTPKQVIKMLREEGQMTLADDDDIDIMIKYYPNRGIDTNDLYTIVEEIEDDGREVIALILDYIKRIRPAEKSKDEKEELKNITNELKNFASELDIPVITAHQLNRGAASVVDAALEANKEDVGRFVGRSNVGTAWEVMENADWACIINVEKKRGAEQQYYLTLKRIKIRYRDPNDLSYFNHPFEMGNKIRLLDDVHLETSLSETSLASDFDAVDLNSKRGKKNATEREIVDDDDSNDLFDFASSIGNKKKKAS
jgi:replicative DNA helicase